MPLALTCYFLAAVRVSHHQISAVWLILWFTSALGLVPFSSPGAAPESVSATARDVTASPGGEALRRRYDRLPEDEFPMRFQLLEAGPMARWEKLDLITHSQALPARADAGVVTITLPNGGQCFLRLVRPKDREAFFELTFSSVETGRAVTVAAKEGEVMLLGSPQNNANDASFVLVVVNLGADR